MLFNLIPSQIQQLQRIIIKAFYGHVDVLILHSLSRDSCLLVPRENLRIYRAAGRGKHLCRGLSVFNFTQIKFENSIINFLFSCSSDYFYAKITLIQLQQEKMKHHTEQ